MPCLRFSLCALRLADTCLLLLTSVSVLFISEDASTLLLGLMNGLTFPGSQTLLFV